MQQSIAKENIRYQATAILIGILLMLIKFAAYFATRSNAIFTDALESTINITAGCFALYSLYYAAKPKDTDHPYGHGKIEFLSAGFEGSLILIAGLVIILKGVYNLFFPQQIQSLDLGILLVAFAGIANFFTGFALEKKGKANHSMTLIADGKHLKSDAYSSIGLFIGLIVVLISGLAWVDNLIAIAFGIIIIVTGLRLIRKSLSGIMDEADQKLLKLIIDLLNKNRRKNWIDMHNLRMIKYGATLHIDCHVTLPWYLNLEEGHEEIKALDEIINQNSSREVEFFIHTDPCIEESCRICIKNDCQVRKQAFKGKVVWTLDNAQKNQKHGYSSISKLS